MTVASSVSRITVSGNSSATSFAFPFKITSSAHLTVTKTTSAGITSTLTLGTHFSVSGVGSESGGSITYPLSGTALPTGDTLTMRRVVPLTQTTDLTNQGAFYAEVHESEFDNLTYGLQQLSDDLTALDAIVDGLIGDVPGALRAYSFTGDGGTVLFSLGVTLTGGVRSVLVAVDGVLQGIGTYAVSGTSLVFSEAPPYGAAIDVRVVGEAYSMTVTDTSLVTATGTTTPRTLSDRFAERINVRDFGALGNGTTDDSVAFLAAFAAGRLLSFGAHIYAPTGKYNLASLTASTSCLRVFSGLTFSGDGYNNTMLVWNDDDGISLFRGPASGRATDVILRDFAIRGTQDVRGNNTVTGAYPIGINFCDNIHVLRLMIEKSRAFGIAIRSSENVTVDGCTIRECGRDGINVAEATRYTLVNNNISNCDDDGLAAHTSLGTIETTPNLGVIANNRLFDCQGIKVLGARHCVIANNTLDCVRAQGISIDCATHNGSTAEGVQALLDVIVTGNKITNVIDRAGIDSLNTDNPYISINGKSAQAGTLAAVPGENDTATGTIIPYYDYLSANGAATTVPTPGGNGIVISNNILSRTLKGGVAFSTYGRGLIFVRGGWADPTLTTAHVGQGIGVRLTGGVLKNVQITGNIFSGLATGVSCGVADKIANLSIKNNTFWDILNYGFLSHPVSSGKLLRAYIESNVFDMDPLHSHSNRSTNGTWLANGGPTGIQFQSGDGVALIRNNTFRNLGRVSDRDTGTLSTYGRWEGNYIEADPASVGSFSTSNKGIGIIYRDNGFTLIHADCDPASATYGSILTPGGTAASSIPTTGKYIAGTFIRNSNPSVAASKVLLGWARLTTGSAHVSGTDWSPLYCTIS
jgi:parallel beta-helix repeat protein